jgi:hypothetical protein
VAHKALEPPSQVALVACKFKMPASRNRPMIEEVCLMFMDGDGFGFD